VEVVAVGLGEPGPREDPVDDLAHAAPPTRSYAGAPPRVNPTPRLYTRAFWIACAVHFTGGMSMGMFLLFPLFVRALGGDELTIGLVLGSGLAVSVGLRPTVGALLDRLGRVRARFPRLDDAHRGARCGARPRARAAQRGARHDAARAARWAPPRDGRHRALRRGHQRRLLLRGALHPRPPHREGRALLR